MHVAILTFDGFNELDSLIAFALINRVKRPGWRATIACPGEGATSMNGLAVKAQVSLAEACAADAIIVGSGARTREVVRDPAIMGALRLDPSRQLIAAQCSGALVLAKLGLLTAQPACTDLTTKPWVQEAGVTVLDQPFHARGNVATAGGCLASHYLAAWIIAMAGGEEAARAVLHYVAPVGEKEMWVARAMGHITPYLAPARVTA
jgi:transcriptional regulator GlxA family with amidase domain